jgi:hypothetical protein
VCTELVNLIAIYLLTLFIKLYVIHPTIVLAPNIFVAILIHFMIETSQKSIPPVAEKQSAQGKASKVVPISKVGIVSQEKFARMLQAEDNEYDSKVDDNS